MKAIFNIPWGSMFIAERKRRIYTRWAAAGMRKTIEVSKQNSNAVTSGNLYPVGD